MPEAAAPVAPAAPEGAAGGRPPLELRGIEKSWPGLPRVLDSVDLSVAGGRAVAIHGANGIGKTTLLRIAAGLIRPEAGSISVCGLDPERDRTAFQRRTGFLSAGNSGLYARLKPEQHLDLAARLALLPRAERREAIARTIELFELGPLCARRVDRLSMGQRQRLRVAMAFLHTPTVALLDEPATSLDDAGIALVARAIEELKARGGAAVICLPAHWEELPGIDAGYQLVGGRLERS
jgi:ABC-2 type transport system ATP-binding protein